MDDKVTVDTSIIENFKNGNIDSFEQIYEFYYKRIYRFCYNYISSKYAIEDVVQNTFLDVFQSIHKLNNVNFFNNWIYKIAYYECQNYYRKKYQNTSEHLNDYTLYNLEDTTSLTVQQMENFNELKAFLVKLFSSMDKKNREVAVLKYFKGFSTKEIAKVLNIPPGTVKSRSHKIKTILIDKINKAYGDT